ncbi:MAG: hypothetical protein P9X24_00445 [Candidatus Hatepunaea meridiana]|nr:hypothetical protein [Candidatus Hatepunaea meridiana]
MKHILIVISFLVIFTNSAFAVQNHDSTKTKIDSLAELIVTSMNKNHELNKPRPDWKNDKILTDWLDSVLVEGTFVYVPDGDLVKTYYVDSLSKDRTFRGIARKHLLNKPLSDSTATSPEPQLNFIDNVKKIVNIKMTFTIALSLTLTLVLSLAFPGIKEKIISKETHPVMIVGGLLRSREKAKRQLNDRYPTRSYHEVRLGVLRRNSTDTVRSIKVLVQFGDEKQRIVKLKSGTELYETNYKTGESEFFIRESGNLIVSKGKKNFSIPNGWELRSTV